MSFVLLNKKYLLEENAVIPISDRGFLFGDGVFTTIKVENGVIHDLPQHLDRLSFNCQQLRIRPPSIREDALIQLLELNKAQTGLWRMKIIVTGGYAPELSLPCREYGTSLVTLKKVTVTPQKNVRLAIYPDPIYSSLGQLKTLSYLERLRIKQYALDMGADDALVLSSEVHLLETSFSNIFWIDGQHFYTVKPTTPILEGLTIQKQIKYAEQQGLDIHLGHYTLSDIPDHATVFLCNVLSEKQPVSSIGEQTFQKKQTV